MDCYKDLSPSRVALFAIGNVRFLPSFLAAALIGACSGNWRRIIRSNLPQVFSPYHTERSNPPNNEVNRPISRHTDRVTGLHA
jgi:hypothetical protein